MTRRLRVAVEVGKDRGTIVTCVTYHTSRGRRVRVCLCVCVAGREGSKAGPAGYEFVQFRTCLSRVGRHECVRNSTSTLEEELRGVGKHVVERGSGRGSEEGGAANGGEWSRGAG